MEENNTWTTWDELLLTCAVKRHGLNAWDSVTTELQNRTSKSLLLNSEICKNKYKDLKQRFIDNKKSDEFDDSIGINIPWLEELRKLRVAELKQEVHRHDLSIQSLQLKVKRLEEERENDDQKPDLQKQNGKSDSGSNEKTGPIEPVKTGLEEKPAGDDSCNGSSETVVKKLSELRNSADESTSFTVKNRRRGEITGGEVSQATDISGKGELSVGFLDVLKGHKRGLVFERRLDSQKTDKYKNIVRQHMDLEIVQSRIDDGSYSSCISKFYLDLLLLCTNAIVFFPKQSPESLAGYSLRDVILKKLKKHRITHNPNPSPEPEPKPNLESERPDPFLTKRKPPTLPILVCRKRSSISTKPPPENEKLPIKQLVKPSNEEESSIEIKAIKEKPVTGVRSMRRSSNRHPIVTTLPSKKTNTNQGDVVPKEELAKKKSGAADFLKRIKKNSPLKEKAEEGGGGGGGNSSCKKDVDVKKRVIDDEKKKGGSGSGGGGKRRVKEDSSSKRAAGRPPKGGKEVVVVGKRGKEGGEMDVGNERPKKRAKR